MAANQEEQKELILKFKDVTGTSDDERARFFLESSDWILQTAICSFYENQPESNLLNSEFSINQEEPNANFADLNSEDIEDNNSRSNFNISSPLAADFNTKMSKKNNTQKKISTNKPKIATLHNMSQRSSDDEEEGQAFYAGGSERSGQQVLGPPKNKNFREQLTEMFRMAHESGAVVDPSTASTSRSRNQNFYQGTGLRLGQTEDDHALVTDDTNNGTERPSRPHNIEPVMLKLWRQGFSINDGDLRSYDDPENKEFLETVMRGQIPNELRQMGSMVSVDLEDHRQEDYKKPATKVKTFKGSGHTLGSPAPKVEKPVTTQAQGSSSTCLSGDSNKQENEKKANEQLKLQTDQPTTMIQIRLADGSRVSGRFNLTHTVNDIRQYIITSRPEYEFSNFILVTAFPTKELSDGSQTIKDADLLNASLMQRIK